MIWETLGDYCKWLEVNFSCEVMIPQLPVILRLDGNNFHSWTRGLDRPFDINFSSLMVETTKYLVEQTNAVIGYTQSDEITLILYSDDRNKLIYNDGKKQKILSKLTGKCVSYFNEKRKELLPSHDRIANFDCRIFQTATLEDACSQLIWRENDAVKNSISSLAQSLFSHSSLQGLDRSQLQDKMMLEKGVNWNDLPSKFKRGAYVKKVKSSISFTPLELSLLPPKHQARTHPELARVRSNIEEVDLPILNKITNRVGVIFFNEEPIVL